VAAKSGDNESAASYTPQMITAGMRHSAMAASRGASCLTRRSFKYSIRSTYSGLMYRVSAEITMKKRDVRHSTKK